MGRTLKLVDRLLERGRHLHDLGLRHEASQLLERLTSFRELPGEVAEECNRRLGEILLDRKKFKRARRHLSAAAAGDPVNPHYQYLLATAIEDDPKADPSRATEHYRRALELDPENPGCVRDFGLHQLDQGAREEGLALLCRALQLDPDNPDMVECVAEAFRDEGEWDEARSIVRAAMFRNPCVLRFRQLWEEHQFQQVRVDQEAANPSPYGLPEKARILQFVIPAQPAKIRALGKTIRRDPPSVPTGPHQTRRVPRR